jgi:hypothetical protein
MFTKDGSSFSDELTRFVRDQGPIDFLACLLQICVNVEDRYYVSTQHEQFLKEK